MVVIHIPMLSRVLLKISMVRRDLCHFHDSSLQGKASVFYTPVCRTRRLLNGGRREPRQRRLGEVYKLLAFWLSSSGSFAKFAAMRRASS
jgi:hypothetical protein